MSKALVSVIGAPTTDQFKTSWSQFMKNNIDMNLLIYPSTPVLDKSDGKFTFVPAIPKVMIDKGEKTDPVFICIWFKNDKNVIVRSVFETSFASFTEDVEIQGQDFLSVLSPLVCAVASADITAGNKYLVNIVYSNKSLTTEVVENPGDMPYSKYGIVSSYVIEVTAQA